MNAAQVLLAVQLALQLEPLALEAWVAMTNKLAGKNDAQILADEQNGWVDIINTARNERGETPISLPPAA
jgi:hypothetical protein